MSFHFEISKFSLLIDADKQIVEIFEIFEVDHLGIVALMEKDAVMGIQVLSILQVLTIASA